MVLFLLNPAFAEEPTHASGIIPNVNHTNTINQTVPNLSIPTIIEWHVGIFAIIGGTITLISILLTVRFVFIDKTHDELIKKFDLNREEVLEEQEKMFDNDKFTKNDIRRFADQISSIDTALADLRRNKKENSHTGTYIDTISMVLLLAVGGLGTTGLFENQFYLLPIIVSTIVIIPIIHFRIQIKHTRHSV